MSSIEKMSIQGIRSFGTGEEKKQLIAFFTPLTLILGPNGTGKTTVIECLKYMTTGEMPPGSRQGGAFIHDPKVARENEVKAQVRLQFRDVRGQVCIASRSLVATQRAKKVEMKTLEGLITRNMPDDTKQSISSKCAEMDREMVALLGVAKPVLENVIFCHQEDSNWPLSEGKALKQKFDDIFASTRYVKALEAIRKFRQEQRGQIQVFAKEISYLKQNKDKAAEIQNSLESTETKYLASKESVKELEVQLRPLEESLQKLNNQSQHIYNLNTKIEKLKSEKSQMEKSVQELRGKIENEFTGSTDDLKRALIDFESKVKEREDKLKEYEEKKADLISEAGELSEKKERLLLQQGKLKLEAEQHKKTIDKRDALIRKVAQEYDMDDYSGTITERRVAKFIKELEELAKQFMADAKTTRERFEEKEAKKQRDLDSARSNKTKLETEQKMKADKIKENQEEIKSLNRKLSEVDASAGRLKDLERDLRRTELEVKDAEKSVNLDSLKSEVAELQKQKGELDAELKVLDAEMSKLSLESAARSQLDIFKKDRTARDEQMRKLKNKNEDSIVHLLGRMPTDNLKRCFDDYVLQKASALNQERTSMQQMQRKLTESETNRKMTMEQLRKKEEELKSHQDDLMEVCESENFDDGLQNLQDKLRKQQDMKGTLEGSAYFYKKYRSSLEKDHPACPFCYRDFEKREDVDNLIGELEKKLSQVPDVLDKVKTSIKQYEAQYNKMLEMKPVRAIMERLEQQEIPQLKTKIKGFSEQIEKLKKNVEEKDEDLESLESDETMAKGLLGDAMMIDKYQSEMRDLDRKISAQSAKLSGGDSGRTMPQVTDEKEELQLQLDNVNRNLDRKRQKISEHSEHLQKLRSTMVELKNQKVQIESDLQQRQHWEEQKLELQNEKETLTVAVQDAKEQLRPLQEKIERLFTEKEELSREKERRFDQDKEQFTKIRDRGREVGTYQKEIEKYIKEGGEQKLEKSEDKMTQLEQAAEKLEKEQKDTNSRIEKIRKDLDTQRMRKRELDDNLLLRKKQKEIQKVDEDIEELDEKLGGLDVRNLEREKRKLNAQLEELMKEKHTAQGRQRGLEDEIKRYKKELKEEQFRDADQKYRNKLIALRTTELANDDLDKYYKALDRSIMSYHRLKMEEINRIIRNLWSNTYKGHDIDTIEIRSDEDDGATSGAAKSRRSYNYRVVMIKGKTVLDMRGRCSAGQKVLASLIIRLALAETFCLNCGILALDEPTTNLDRANIESLATALVDIIRVRHAQRNFQLVVITHDEDFVELLGKSDFVEEFYKVSKTDSGWSKLSRVRIEDIHLHR